MSTEKKPPSPPGRGRPEQPPAAALKGNTKPGMKRPATGWPRARDEHHKDHQKPQGRRRSRS